MKKPFGLIISSVALFTILIITGCSSIVRIGSIVPPYPVNTNAIGGSCIGVSENYSPCGFAIGILENEKSEPIGILSEKMADPRETKNHHWIVLDFIALPSSDKKTHLEFSTCSINGQSDETIVAIVPNYDESSPEHIKARGWAYRIGLPSGKFISIDPAIVSCINTAIGAD